MSMSKGSAGDVVERSTTREVLGRDLWPLAIWDWRGREGCKSVVSQHRPAGITALVDVPSVSSNSCTRLDALLQSSDSPPCTME